MSEPSTPLFRSVDASVQPCTVHLIHTPKPLSSEWHHIVPVAWQLHTPLPPGTPPPAPGPDTEGRGELWDSRGIWICPTGHRSTHWWIVKLMREVDHLQTEDINAVAKAVKPRARNADFSLALDALTRLAPYGSFLALVKQGEWGQS